MAHNHCDGEVAVELADRLTAAVGHSAVSLGLPRLPGWAGYPFTMQAGLGEADGAPGPSCHPSFPNLHLSWGLPCQLAQPYYSDPKYRRTAWVGEKSTACEVRQEVIISHKTMPKPRL